MDVGQIAWQNTIMIGVQIAGQSGAFRPRNHVAAYCDTDRQAVV